MIYRIGIW